MKRFVLFAVLLSAPVFALQIRPNILNGREANDPEFNEIVRLDLGEALCTASIVGPRTIITAAHCVPDSEEKPAHSVANTLKPRIDSDDEGGGKAEPDEEFEPEEEPEQPKFDGFARFEYDGKTYKAKLFKNPVWPNKDVDIAIGVVTEEIVGAFPFEIGGKATIGMKARVFGFGLTGDDPESLATVLMNGYSVVRSFVNYDMVMKTRGGSALSFGDSGGPVFIQKDNRPALIAINSKGNIRDTSYCTRLDIPESQEFLKTAAQEHSVEICGINKKCPQ